MEFTPAPAIRLEFTEITDRIYLSQSTTEDSISVMMSVLDVLKALSIEEKLHLQNGLKINHKNRIHFFSFLECFPNHFVFHNPSSRSRDNPLR